MIVKFNLYNSNIKKQSPNFKSLKDGKIVAEEVAKYASNAAECRKYIFLGTYKPTAENLEALLKAKRSAATDEYSGLEKTTFLDEAIEMLKIKAKEAGINLEA